ncbi:MAG: peptidoglycan-binding protein LysM [Lachnospiraceae bacterium]|nr:peptidoglycan-binding protein LysM [Lachnospiraceae bacterium]
MARDTRRETKGFHALSGFSMTDMYKGPIRSSGGVPYDFYIGPGTATGGSPLLLPVAPGKLTVKINNSNKSCSLMNEGEVNILKSPGLTEIEFEALLPNTQYPFAVYKNGFRNAKTYLDRLEKLKKAKRTFQFIVSRMLPDGSTLFSTNMTCSLEEYTIEEDVESNGRDILVSVHLKQYRPYGVKKCKVKTKKSINLKKARDKKIVHLDKGNLVIRSEGTEYVTLEIKKTITLYNLAKLIYGDGKRYTLILKEAPDAFGSGRGKGKKAPSWKKSTKLKKGTLVTVPLSYYS